MRQDWQKAALSATLVSIRTQLLRIHTITLPQSRVLIERGRQRCDESAVREAHSTHRLTSPRV